MHLWQSSSHNFHLLQLSRANSAMLRLQFSLSRFLSDKASGDSPVVSSNDRPYGRVESRASSLADERFRLLFKSHFLKLWILYFLSPTPGYLRTAISSQTVLDLKIVPIQVASLEWQIERRSKCSKSFDSFQSFKLRISILSTPSILLILSNFSFLFFGFENLERLETFLWDKPLESGDLKGP